MHMAQASSSKWLPSEATDGSRTEITLHVAKCQQCCHRGWPGLYETGMCWQVSSRLASGAEALKTSGDLRSISLRQSISGALQRVSGIRSPSGGAPAPGESPP